MPKEHILLGSVDDAVARDPNPWPGIPKTLVDLNHLLVFLCLFGPRPIIPLGNILYNQAFADAFIFEERSPLITISSLGLCTLLKREASIQEAVESRAIQSHDHAKDFMLRLRTVKGTPDAAAKYISYIDSRLESKGVRVYKKTDKEFERLLGGLNSVKDSPMLIARQKLLENGVTLNRTAFEKYCEAHPEIEARRILPLLHSIKHIAHFNNLRTDFCDLADLTLETNSYPFLLQEGTFSPRGLRFRLSDAQAIKLKNDAQGHLDRVAQRLRVPACFFNEPWAWQKLGDALADISLSELSKAKLALRIGIETLLSSILNGKPPSLGHLDEVVDEFNRCLEVALGLRARHAALQEVFLAAAVGTATFLATSTAALEAGLDIPPWLSVPVSISVGLFLNEQRIRRVVDGLFPRLQGVPRQNIEHQALSREIFGIAFFDER